MNRNQADRQCCRPASGRPTRTQTCLVCFVCLISACDYVQAQDVEDAAHLSEQTTFFEERIHTVLVAKCYECHSGRAVKVEGGLLLDSREAARKGGDSGPAIVPGQLEDSLLFQAITATKDSMPPGEPLDALTIADFRKWILAGAADPRDQPDATVIEPDYAEARSYWAFQPVKVTARPTVVHADLVRNPIDSFVLSKLEHAGLLPVPAASEEVLVRRVFFDLIGVPPTPQEVAAFAANPTELAWQNLIDGLLSRPEYGERWAQHWLDVVRYAETEGFEYDRMLPDIWRYRDYVIDSLNNDKPYDQFLAEQLAGDEAKEPSAETHVATGFFRLGTVRRNAGNQKVASSRNEVLTERTDIIGSAILGLTIGCARCHDHKFDPISQRDYYRLQAFVAAAHEDNRSLQDDAEQKRLLAMTEKIESKIAAIKETLANLDRDAEKQAREEILQLKKQLPPPGPTICGIRNDPENSAPVKVLRRGDPELPGSVVGMRLPGVLTDKASPELPCDAPQPRTQLVRQLLDRQSALLTRVIVNRVWQGHFGIGLVSTPNDFGKNGSAPSHPELLEYLSQAFIDSGWRFKALHRTILQSSTYRQASQVSDKVIATKIDPANRLLSSFPKRRLSGEELRDAMLAISGKLNSKRGGESVVLPVEQGLIDQLYEPTQWVVSEDPDEHFRRSIYLLAKRNLRLPFMEVFDQPTSQTSCAVRERSTHARQALELLNGAMTNELASAFAQRLHEEAGEDPAKIVERAFWLTATRPPTVRELDLSQQFLTNVGLHEFCLAMFNINAFLYLD